jgi:very-short-patch-repair endonuclease
MLELTGIERLLLYLITTACRPAAVQMLLWVLCLSAIIWMAKRMLGYDDALLPFSPTLYNPARLHDTLCVFARSPTQQAPGSDRHRTEALCRQLLEAMLSMRLPKVRPKWLVNPTTKRSLELDMYNEEHRLAFEYDGAQHDVFTPHYHGNEHYFRYRQLLDKLKDELCRDAGVLLIRIPWSEVTVQNEVRTARFLERLLNRHQIPHQSVLVEEVD